MTEENLSFLSTDDIKSHENYLNAIKTNNLRDDYTQIFDKTDPDLLKILEKMLQFNPYFRPTAKQLLKDKYFDEIRKKEVEKAAKLPYRLKVPDKDCKKTYVSNKNDPNDST